MNTGRVEAVVQSAAEKLNDGVPLHELTNAEWRAVCAQHRLNIIEHLGRGRLAGHRSRG